MSAITNFPLMPPLLTVSQVVITGSDSFNSSYIGYPWFK